MADALNPIVSFLATTASRLPDLTIKDGQLIFIKDKQRIALDLNGKRTFYNQIITLQTDEERQSLLAPISELYYFVIETAVLWTYNGGWIQVTTKPDNVIYIGDDLPESGTENKLYVNKSDKNISVWDDVTQNFISISNYTESISSEEINNLFNEG